MARTFLALVGFIYILLAVWCAFAPETTSQSVGFILKPGSGQSEFLTVYGGLELALGIVFLRPLFQKEVTHFSLYICVIVHGCLVMFRTLGFVLFSGFESTTYALAGGEWLIFLMSLTLYIITKRSTKSSLE
ncbi:hypothetical protein [Gimesia aquarii]|uniref:DUF4345 domain-containing protein n=1 Tax=Gimesia aquarii TaxID=2527964 RepID=A0A517VU29_9PLAN|nr:hypothetical protein [Gimesia aquarii]QDT96512.1 hypothetical protein V144x_19690 [Gimesia aquarii]